MTVFVAKGDSPMNDNQLNKRTQRYINRDWPEWKRERSIRMDDGEFNTYMTSVSNNTDTNRSNNTFNQQLADYNAAVARLAKYRLADGRAEVTEDQETFDEFGNQVFDEQTGEPVMTPVVVVSAIDPVDPTIEQDVYDEMTGEVTGTETVPNPLIVADDAERAAAQAVIDATPQEVKDFS